MLRKSTSNNSVVHKKLEGKRITVSIEPCLHSQFRFPVVAPEVYAHLLFRQVFLLLLHRSVCPSVVARLGFEGIGWPKGPCMLQRTTRASDRRISWCASP
uniref:Predicted protein n=1 Tax=Hordeum vulgare subsp. vulgare TaxID=112509 RepID=F2DCK5_HORVV|nr:predicted protein [Hordeum vulgare subsp. vulgare]